jgi:hypothetical protein
MTTRVGLHSTFVTLKGMRRVVHLEGYIFNQKLIFLISFNAVFQIKRYTKPETSVLDHSQNSIPAPLPPAVIDLLESSRMIQKGPVLPNV